LYVFLGCVLALNFMAGLCCIACLLYGQMLRPHSDQGTLTAVWGVGAGEGLERHVRSLMWLRSWGLLRCRVILDDGGLDPDGRELARTLTRRWPELELLSEQTL